MVCHVDHHGNQRRAVYHKDRERELYLADLAAWAHDCGLATWGYCLMTNHIHLPAVGRVQQPHARRVHAARGLTGHLWAYRYHSAPLHGAHPVDCDPLRRVEPGMGGAGGTPDRLAVVERPGTCGGGWGDRIDAATAEDENRLELFG